MVVLFIQSVTYSLVNPDDGFCGNQKREEACLSERSAFNKKENKCVWDHSDGCSFNEPDTDYRIVIFVAFVSAIISIPVAIFANWVICNVVIAPVIGSDSLNSSGSLKSQRAKAVARVYPQTKPNYTTDQYGMLDRWRLSLVGKFRNVSEAGQRGISDEELQQLPEEVRSELNNFTSAIKAYRGTISDTSEKNEFDDLWCLDENGDFISKKNLNVAIQVLGDILRTRQDSKKELELMEEYSSQELLKQRLLFLFQIDILPGIQKRLLAYKTRRDFFTCLQVTYWEHLIGVSLVILLNAFMLLYVLLFALNQTPGRQSAWFSSFILWLVLEIFVVSTNIVIILHMVIPFFGMKDLTKIKEHLIQSLEAFYEEEAKITAKKLHAVSTGTTYSASVSSKTAVANTPVNLPDTQPSTLQLVASDSVKKFSEDDENVMMAGPPSSSPVFIDGETAGDPTDSASIVSRGRSFDVLSSKVDSIRLAPISEKLKPTKSQAIAPVDSTDFNVAEYLFVSRRVASHFPDLAEARWIARFRTVWPKQSYKHTENFSRIYNARNSFFVRSVSQTFMLFFFSMVLGLDDSILDIIVEMAMTACIGYLSYLHVLLWRIAPYLPFIPAICLYIFVKLLISVFSYYNATAQRRDEISQKMQRISFIFRRCCCFFLSRPTTAIYQGNSKVIPGAMPEIQTTTPTGDRDLEGATRETDARDAQNASALSVQSDTNTALEADNDDQLLLKKQLSQILSSKREVVPNNNYGSTIHPGSNE